MATHSEEFPWRPLAEEVPAKEKSTKNRVKITQKMAVTIIITSLSLPANSYNVCRENNDTRAMTAGKYFRLALSKRVQKEYRSKRVF